MTRPRPGQVAVSVDAHDLDGLLGFHTDVEPNYGGAVARLRLRLATALQEAADPSREDLTAQLLRQRRLALSRVGLARRGMLNHWTPLQLAVALHADLTDGHPASMPAPDPAAPLSWGLVRDGRIVETTRDPDRVRGWNRVDETVVPLAQAQDTPSDPAPGAVAAAPPGDERAVRIERLHEAVEMLHDEALQEPATWAADRALADAVWALLKRHEDLRDVDEGAARAALAAPPAGHEDEARTRGLLKSAWRESEGWRGQAERLARLLVRDRVALARVKTQRDAAAVDLGKLVEAWLGSGDESWVLLGEDLRDLVDPVAVEDCARCTPTRVEPERGPGYCNEQGPWGERCTQDAGHRYAHDDNGTAFTDRWRDDCAASGHVRPEK